LFDLPEELLPGTPEGDRLKLLALPIEDWERKHSPVDPPDPVETIKFRMEQQGLTVADMRPYIEPPNRVYEVLSKKRGLSSHRLGCA
jgi:HTH-type transcriptional regulator/antitoxin HigA